jgi:hypothetical protein
VDLNDRVVVDRDRPLFVLAPAEHRSLDGQLGEEPGGDRVELLTWPKVNVRGNDPNVEGAQPRLNSRPVPRQGQQRNRAPPPTTRFGSSNRAPDKRGV